MNEHQPTVYATLVDAATRGLEGEVEDHVRREMTMRSYQLAEWVNEQIRKAYVAGVRDGFAQGVAAEADATALEGTEKP